MIVRPPLTLRRLIANAAPVAMTSVIKPVAKAIRVLDQSWLQK